MELLSQAAFQHGSLFLSILGYSVSVFLVLQGVFSVYVLNSLVHHYAEASKKERQVTISWFLVLIGSAVGAIIFFFIGETNMVSLTSIIS